MQEEKSLKKKKLALLKKKKKLAAQKKKGDEEEVEARFLRVKYDPIFQKMSKKDSKIKIDSRFKEILSNNSKFSTISSTKTDKYGRRAKKVKSHEKELFYTKEEEENKKDEEPLPFHWSAESSSNSESEYDGDLHELLGEQVEEYNFLEGEEEKIEMKDISSKRLAMMNYDWENITPGDIFITLSSFLPPGGEIISVKKYLSQFGDEMLKKEEIEGPIFSLNNNESSLGLNRLNPQSSESEANKEANEEISELNQKLNDKDVRLYELNRLKYFYSVVEFDSEKTADFVYNNLNGMEIMSTGVTIDLRVIPSELEIPQKLLKEVVKEKPKKASGFNFFVKAKQHTNVEITWEKPEKGNKNAYLFEVDDDVLDKKIDLTEIINSDDLADENELSEEDGDNEKDIGEIRRRLLGNFKEKSERNDVYSDFDKSKKKTNIDVKFLAAFENEESSSSDEEDKGKIVFSRNFKKDLREKLDDDKEEDKVDLEVDDDDFFNEDEENSGKSEKKSKKQIFKERLKEKRRERAEKEKERRLNVKSKREKINREADLGLLTKRGEMEFKGKNKDFEVEFDSRFDRIWKDGDMSVDPTNPNYVEEKAKVIFDEKKKRKKLKI